MKRSVDTIQATITATTQRGLGARLFSVSIDRMHITGWNQDLDRCLQIFNVNMILPKLLVVRLVEGFCFNSSRLNWIWPQIWSWTILLPCLSNPVATRTRIRMSMPPFLFWNTDISLPFQDYSPTRLTTCEASSVLRKRRAGSRSSGILA